MIEEWKKVPDVDYLWVSTLGRVKSEEYMTPMPYGGFKTNRLQPTYGHSQQVTKNYKRKIIVFRRKTYRIATLVARTFLGERPTSFVISHINENSLDNSVNNLCYESQKDNLNRPFLKEYHRKMCRQKMAA